MPPSKRLKGDQKQAGMAMPKSRSGGCGPAQNPQGQLMELEGCLLTEVELLFSVEQARKEGQAPNIYTMPS